MHQGDARSLPFADQTIDAVVTSPPYWTMYDYCDVHRLSYLAFDWPRQSDQLIGRKYGIERDGIGFTPPRYMSRWYYDEFHGENTTNGRALREYFVRMRKHLEEIRRVIRPRGAIAYAVANSFRSGARFRLATALAQLIREVGFDEIAIASRMGSHRRILPAGRDWQTGRFSGRDSTGKITEVIIFARG